MILKSIVLSSIVFLSFFFFDVLACKGQEIDNLRLDADYNSILDYQPTQICADPKDLFCTEKKDVIQYLYITNSVVVDDLDEWVDERTLNTRVYEKNGKRSYRVYSGQPFIKTGDVWYETGVNYVDKTTWDSYTESTLTEEIISKLNPFKIYSLKAQTYYAQAGDGFCSNDKSGTTWADVWDDTSCNSARYNQQSERTTVWYNGSGRFIIERSYLPFDASALDDDANIESASIFLTVAEPYDNDNDAQGYTVIATSTQTNNDTVVTNDYSKLGSIAVSNTIDTTSQSDESQQEFILNELGIDNISLTGWTKFGIREGHDIENSAVNGATSVYVGVEYYHSEYTGTTKDPYLEITVAEEPPAQGTSTVYNTYCIPEENEDVTKITACSYISSTTGITYTNYQIPFIIWVVVALPFVWVGSRLLLEYLIRLRVIFN